MGRELVRTTPSGWDTLAPPRDGLDITRPDSIEAEFARRRPDVVINAAAYTAVDQAETDAGSAWRVNAEGTENLARAANRCGARFVHISTDYVFDGAGCRPYRPGDATNPVNEYGRTKLEGERRALRFGGNLALVLRTSWLYAAHGRNFVNTMLALMRTRDSLRVVDDQIGTPTWARSLARAIWRIVPLRETPAIIHWSDAGVCSWYDFSVAIRDEAMALGLLERRPVIEPVPSTEYPTPARRPHYSVLDKTESWRLLGTHAPHWRESLRDMLKEMAEHGSA